MGWSSIRGLIFRSLRGDLVCIFVFLTRVRARGVGREFLNSFLVRARASAAVCAAGGKLLFLVGFGAPVMPGGSISMRGDQN